MTPVHEDRPTPGERGLSAPEDWVDRYGDELFRYAYLRLRDPASAEDAVQETFLAAFRARSEFQGRSSELTWLVSILRRKIVDCFRRAAREQPVVDIETEDPEADGLFQPNGWWRVKPGPWVPDAGALLEQSEFWDVFQGCFSRLPPRLAAAFSLRVLEELEPQETCKVLGVTATNLGVMLHRARARLRRCLEARWFQRPEGE
ncbi:MAG: sigma-70 family RNA polymerase sigma factor [Planctomycetes bacterium]|nr:sigma-70 family RNA polymerase sigma factor [Planctomycetota bacterium]